MTRGEDFNWYYSRDEERYYPIGPVTREEAIEYGREECGYEAFWLTEANHRKLRLRIDSGWLLEHLENINEECIDPEETLEDQLGVAKDKQALDRLERYVEQAIDMWFSVEGLDKYGWAFGEQRHSEFVPFDHRGYYHDLIAKMGRPDDAQWMMRCYRTH